MDLALNRLLKPAKKASSPVARTPGRAGKDGFLENATYLAPGSFYGGIFEVHCNTLSVLLGKEVTDKNLNGVYISNSVSTPNKSTLISFLMLINTFKRNGKTCQFPRETFDSY
jgi:hypothetical protein